MEPSVPGPRLQDALMLSGKAREGGAIKGGAGGPTTGSRKIFVSPLLSSKPRGSMGFGGRVGSAGGKQFTLINTIFARLAEMLLLLRRVLKEGEWRKISTWEVLLKKSGSGRGRFGRKMASGQYFTE